MEADLTLLNAARRMDKVALGKIFDLYSSALYNYVQRLCDDPMLADHIVGDVFAKLLEQLSLGKGPTSNLRSYLYEITYHQIVDEARYSKHSAPLEVAHSLQPDIYSAFSSLEDGVLFAQLVHALQNKLTADQRNVIVLRFMEEFSLRETAAIMGKTIQNVKVIQLRALAALHRALEHRGIRKAASFDKARYMPNAPGLGSKDHSL